MFDHDHYVPILKGRAAEYRALERLEWSTKSRLTPLIEIPSIPWDFTNEVPAKTIDEHLETVPQRLGASWTAGRPIFIDLALIAASERMADGGHPLAWLFDRGRSQDLMLVPVTGLTRDIDYQNAVAQVAAEDSNGVCVRIEADDMERVTDLEAELTALFGALGIAPDRVDLIIDFGAMSPGQGGPLTIAARAVLSSLPFVREWRTLTLAGSAFPENLSQFTAYEPDTTQRTEWLVWEGIVDRGGLPRTPTFGDYGIQHPQLAEIDPRVMRMSANLRYTTEREWLILKGRDARRHGFDQFNDLCGMLTSMPEFSGVGFSWGDGYIGDCSNGSEGPGNATTWRQAGTNHHLALVSRQIASRFGA